MRDDSQYYYRRAEAELKMAQRSDVPQAVKAHYMLAGYYLDYIHADESGEHSELAQLMLKSSETGSVSN